MHTVFDSKTISELIKRIDQLKKTSVPEWGAMNISQMIKHCIACEEMYQGKIKLKRAFIGKLFGKMAYKHTDHHLSQFGV